MEGAPDAGFGPKLVLSMELRSIGAQGDAPSAEPTDRLGHTEYCSNYALVRAVTGLDPRDRPRRRGATSTTPGSSTSSGSTNDGPVGLGQRGRTTDMGHAEFLEGGVDRRDAATCPFKDVEEVLASTRSRNTACRTWTSSSHYYERLLPGRPGGQPEPGLPAGYYKTIVSGA